MADDTTVISSLEESSTSTLTKSADKIEGLNLYRVWKRPVFQQYSYLYDYRHNYYDDVIDYLDRRQRGIVREIPRPQTWAERALRNYTTKIKSTEAYSKRVQDIILLSNMRTCARFYDYHIPYSSPIY